MNRIFLTYLIVVLCLRATSDSRGQGTVAFQNNASTLVEIVPDWRFANTRRPVTSNDGVRIQLFYQVKTGNAAPAALDVSSAFNGGYGGWSVMPGAASVVGVPIEGRFGASFVTTGFDAAPGGEVWLQAVAWNGGAASIQEAAQVSFLTGASTVWSQFTGDGVILPPVSTLGLFTGVVLVGIPEPTTLSLACVFAAGVMLFRRR